MRHVVGHDVEMVLAMLAAMLLRRRDYAEHHAPSPWPGLLRRPRATEAAGRPGHGVSERTDDSRSLHESNPMTPHHDRTTSGPTSPGGTPMSVALLFMSMSLDGGTVDPQVHR